MHARTLVLCALALGGVAVSLVLNGCGGEAETAEPSTGKMVVYTVRGQVVGLADDSVTGNTLTLHHEPIPSFESQGEVVGMPAMTMPFALKEGLPTEGVAPGVIVEISFAVEYNEQGLAADSEVTEIILLPTDTELHFNGESHDEAPADDSSDSSG